MSETTAPTHVIRFGVFEVDLRSGELRRNGAKIKIQEQPFHVLAMLLGHPGEIVTREELQKALWSTDTFVDFEHGLNKAINKIREALGDDADNPRFVETLARRGYRFIAPVVGAGLVPARSAGGPAQGLPRGAPLQRRWMIAAGTLVAILVVLLAFNVAGLRDRILRRAAPAKSALPPLRAVPFTSFPGQEMHPAFSPDGNQIAFAWNGKKEDNWDIYVKVIGTESILRLTTNPADDFGPAWSPDGRYIAFSRHTTEGEDGIFVVAALGGPERKMHSSRPQTGGPVDWSPDGRYLSSTDAVPAQKSTGIWVLSVENPEDRRMLTSPPGYQDDVFPRFSPDGQTLAFVRLLTEAGAFDIEVVPAAGGEARRLTFDNTKVYGLAWTPDGTHIIFSSDRLGASRLWKIRASGGEPEALPVGQEYAFDPSLSRDGHRLAYTREYFDTNIWRFAVARVKGQIEAPTRFISSTAGDQGPQYSPDGKRIVFASDRSGTGISEIWLCDSDGSNAVQLTHFGGPLAGTPRWSPDGRQIAFDSEPEGHGDIYVLGAEGGRPRRLTTETSNDYVPSWSRDGTWIYFASDRTGTWQVWKAPVGGQALQVTKNGGFAAFESFDGKTLYFAKGLQVPGLWKVPVEGGDETPVLPQLAAGFWGYWALSKDGIYFYNVKTKAIEFLDFATRKTTEVARPQKEPISYNPGLAVSPDGRWILYSQIDIAASDIMLVENFRW